MSALEKLVRPRSNCLTCQPDLSNARRYTGFDQDHPWLTTRSETNSRSREPNLHRSTEVDSYIHSRGSLIPSIPIMFCRFPGRQSGIHDFSEGMSEDIITALSKLRWFYVIARNSAFVYKGRKLHLAQMAIPMRPHTDNRLAVRP